ncbi:hypothetical protein QUB80_11345 [Chlorogloeopsis sp. ULAP01]|uniref:hypothetical protein n=1 Tax=Chlorogloeopsis sp. ULAP01 TaxID=3056483 RepID=UPI0025AA347E|nr:hypothetical protein [Chlorogloeopsis sp. ULAP01]MDM9381299.1 hypothetical protein [Chlorogloeopsis sp. ULAP01]
MSYQRLPFLLFLLPLLLVGIVFWVTSDLVTKQLLSLPYRTFNKLQADQLPQAHLKLNFKIVAIEIEKEEKVTQVEIKTGNSIIKKLEFEFLNSNYNSYELAIAQKLGFDPQIKKLKSPSQLKIEIPVNLKVIKAEVNQEQGFSSVVVKTANDPLTNLEFMLPLTEINLLEVRIAQVLNLPIEEVRNLIRYQIKK